MNFNQCYFSEGLKFFEKEALNAWSCVPYNDLNKPAIFHGIYHKKDIKTFNNHNSHKLLMLGGGDVKNIKYITNTKNTYFMGYDNFTIKLLENLGIKCKPYPHAASTLADIPINYPLGDKIYVYSGNHKRDYLSDDKGTNKGLYNECIKPLIDILGVKKFIFAKKYTKKKLIQKVYKSCFIFIKPNVLGGLTTMWEMGKMGRKTITSDLIKIPNVYNADLEYNKKDSYFDTKNVIGYKDLQNVIDLINRESEKIGNCNIETSWQTINLIKHKPWKKLDYWI